MKWYSSLSKLLLKDEAFEQEEGSLELREQLAERIVELYKVLLKYVIKSICAYDRNPLLQVLRDAVSLDQWSGSLTDVDGAEASVTKASSEYGVRQSSTYLQLICNMHLSTAQNEVMQKLYVVDMAAEIESLQSRKDPLLPDSYKWILDNNDYQDFVDWRSSARSLFWVKGNPGKGKTMLLIGIIRELTSRIDTYFDEAHISYFFCQATDPKLNSATAVLRGLIWMLLRQERSLIRYLDVKDYGQDFLRDRSAFYVLKKIFQNMMSDRALKRVYFVVDALDECTDEEPGLSQLLTLISEMKGNVRWLVSSRKRADIEDGLGAIDLGVRVDLELNAASVSAAVSAYITHKVEELARLKKYNSDLQNDVKSHLESKADGTFLWVALVCRELARPQTLRPRTLNVLHSFQAGLTPIYQRMMEQIEGSECSDICKEILAAVMIARRRIHLNELASVAGVVEDFSDDPESLEDLVGLCGSFLVIREGIIYFVHQSAQDYLNSEQPSSKVFPTGRVGAHCGMVSRSLEMMSKILKKDIYTLQHPGLSTDVIECPDPDPLIPVRYACTYWADHLSEIPTNLREESGLRDNGAIDTFLRNSFLYWLEAQSLMRGFSSAVTTIRTLDRLLAVRNHLALHAIPPANIMKQNPKNSAQLVSLVRDANRFVLYNRGIIEAAPLQVYASALVFSPLNSEIRTLFEHERPWWISEYPRVEQDWSPCLFTLALGSSVNSVAFSIDGKKLASGSDDATVRVWDAETGELQKIFNGHNGPVLSVVFSPDAGGKWLASGSLDGSSRIWNAETGELHKTYYAGDSEVRIVAFSPGPYSKWLASLSWSSSTFVGIWNIESGQLQHKFECGSNIASIAFSPCGSQLAIDEEHGVGMWHIQSGELQAMLKVGERQTNLGASSLIFSPDGTRLSSSWSGVLRTWNTETEEVEETIHHIDDRYVSLATAFSPDGARVARSANNLVHLWDVERATLTRDGDSIEMSAPFDRRELGFQAPNTLEGHTSQILSLTFSPTGNRLASGSQDCTLRIWDTEREHLHIMDERYDDTHWSCFSLDRTWLAFWSTKTLQIWNVTSGRLLRELMDNIGPYPKVDLSCDGQRIAASSYGTSQLWNSTTGELQHTLRGHRNRVIALVFSLDGKWLASGGVDGTARIWNTETGEQEKIFTTSSPVWGVAFSPNNTLLATASDYPIIRIWTILTGESLDIKHHRSPIFSLVFINGEQVASCLDKVLHIWDVKTGELQRTLDIGCPLLGLSVIHDGSQLITDFGIIDMARSDGTPKWTGYGFGFGFEKSRITWNGMKVLWIPWEYRPLDAAVGDHVVVIGRSSPMFIRFERGR
jgi:WD40 repeat protein